MNGRIVRTNKSNHLPVVSKIKIGEKSEKGYPKSLDYFKPFGKYADLFYKAYPENTNKIPILFISDDLNFCCNERLELRNNKGDLFAKGDGDIFEVWNENPKIKAYESFSISEHPDIEKKCAIRTGTKWQRVLTLRFIIPKIKGVLGLWQLETKADKSSIDQIRDTFDYILDRTGTVTRILFDLTVTKVKSQKPDDPSSYPVLNLIPNVSEGNLMQLKEFVESGAIQSLAYVNDSQILKLSESKPKQIEEKISDENPLFDYKN